jgi:hypothetical protein
VKKNNRFRNINIKIKINRIKSNLSIKNNKNILKYNKKMIGKDKNN